jgi:flavin reductase ActVB
MMIDVVVAFKEAFARFPSGVVIATMIDAQGQARGFTASSFSSVSLDPPLVLVCLSTAAECYPAFLAAERFAISLLRPRHEEVARAFATRGADKFSLGDFVSAPHGLPVLKDALATMVCRKVHDYLCGDHSILLGEIEAADIGDGSDALVYYRRRFWELPDSPSHDEVWREAKAGGGYCSVGNRE